MDGAYIALKGYKFQFDRTILEIFNNPDKQIQIEQIQDYGFDDYYIQVKYHNTDYTHAQQKAKLKKPILQLIDQFKEDKSKKFILFIFFKGITQHNQTFTTTDELDVVIGKTTKISELEKNEFIKNFTIMFADDFESQYKMVIDKIKADYSKSLAEAEIYYSVISSYLLDIIIKNPPISKSARTTTKKEIDNVIKNGKEIIFKSAYIDVLDKEQQLKYLHKLFFKSALNNEPHERFFIIEITKSPSVALLQEIVLSIKNKWSKNKTKTIPDNDRFVPYIFFNGLPKSELKALKDALQKDNYVIKDGYDFMDAEFNIKSIQESPTFSNKLFFKIINSEENLTLLVNNISRTKEVYQFYSMIPLELLLKDKHVKIEIEDIKDIKNII